MIGPGLKALAREYHFRQSGRTLNGIMEGFAVSMWEGMGYKAMAINLGRLEGGKGNEEVDLLDLLSKPMKSYRIVEYHADGPVLTIHFYDNPGTMKRIRNYIKTELPVLKARGFAGAARCGQCGEPMGAEEPLMLMLGEHPIAVHARCADQAEAGIRFVLQLGHALHRYGTPAHRIEEVMTILSGRLGIPGRFVSTPTSISASFGPPEALKSTLIRADPGEVDLNRLALLDALVNQVLQGRCGIVEGTWRLDEILAAPSRYGPAVVVVFYSICSCFGAQLFGGGLAEMIAGTVLGAFVGLLAMLAGKRPGFGRVLEPAAAFGASALSVIGARLIAPYSTGIATLGALIFLLPGLTLSVAMTEVATKNLISGTSRLMGATLIFLQLGFGVALGQKIDLFLPEGPAHVELVPLPDWVYPLTILMVVVSLAILFRARIRDVGFILLAGVLAYAAARFGARYIGAELGAFVGALVLGMISNLYGRLLDRPALVLNTVGIMLLVPGSLGYRSLESLIQAALLPGIDLAFRSVLVLVALSGGVLVANSIVSPRRLL